MNGYMSFESKDKFLNSNLIVWGNTVMGKTINNETYDYLEKFKTKENVSEFDFLIPESDPDKFYGNYEPHH